MRRVTSKQIAISIHALREESDKSIIDDKQEIGNFNPRSPRGERQSDGTNTVKTPLISIHALREESD